MAPMVVSSQRMDTLQMQVMVHSWQPHQLAHPILLTVSQDRKISQIQQKH